MIKAAIAEMTKDQLRAEPFDIKVGNTVKVHVKIKEGSKQKEFRFLRV